MGAGTQKKGSCYARVFVSRTGGPRRLSSRVSGKQFGVGWVLALKNFKGKGN